MGAWYNKAQSPTPKTLGQSKRVKRDLTTKCRFYDEECYYKEYPQFDNNDQNIEIREKVQRL